MVHYLVKRKLLQIVRDYFWTREKGYVLINFMECLQLKFSNLFVKLTGVENRAHFI